MGHKYRDKTKQVDHLNRSSAEELADAFIEEIDVPNGWRLDKDVRMFERDPNICKIAVLYPDRGASVAVNVTPDMDLQAIEKRSAKTSIATKHTDNIVYFLNNKLEYDL